MGFVNKLVVTSLFVIAFWAQYSFAQSPELLWEKRYDGGSSDTAYGVAADRNGNIIVTGTSESDYLTIKYDPNGNVLWTAPYDSGGPDTAYAVATDSLNNIIVVGKATVYNDWYIVKYNSSGSKIWSTSLNLGQTDVARSISVDSNDNILVTGHNIFREDFYAVNSWDYFTVKYDSNGNYLWYKNYNLYDDRAYDVTIDSNNSIIVVGASDDGYDIDIHTIKYDSNGNELWSKDFDSGYKDYGYGVSTDSAGNVIVVGYSYDPSTVRANCVILKYDSRGGELWRKTYSKSNFDQAYCVTIDRYDNIILGGKSNGSLNIVIYDRNGNLLWDYNHSNFVGAAYSVDVDVYNDIVVAGILYSSSTGSDFQVMKFRGYGSSTPTTTTTTTTVTTTTTSTTTTTIRPTTTTTTTTTTTMTVPLPASTSSTTTTTLLPATTTSTTTTTTRTTTTTSSTTTTLPLQNICADPVSFYFEATLPGPNPVNQMLMVSECKGYNISWSAERSDSWLSLGQAQDPTLMEVSVDVSGISNEGVYNGSIIILAEGAANSPLQIPITLKATEAPLPVENLEARRVDNTIILKWDANDAYDLAGYKVYYDFDGLQPPYSGAGAAEGNSGEIFVYGTETAQLTGLPEGVMYVAVTAFDHEGNESGYSNVVIPNSVSINNGAESVFNNDVRLYLNSNIGITHVSISNNGERWSNWRRVMPIVKWRLSKESGEKSVYVMFKDNNKKIYEPAKDTILKETRRKALNR